MKITVNDLVEGGIYYVDEDKAPDTSAAELDWGGFVRFNKINDRHVAVYQQEDGSFDWQGAKVEERTVWSFKNLDDYSSWAGFEYESEEEFVKESNALIEGADLDWPGVQDMIADAGFDEEDGKLVYHSEAGEVLTIACNPDAPGPSTAYIVSLSQGDSCTFRYLHELQRFLIDKGFQELSDSIGVYDDEEYDDDDEYDDA